MANGNYKHDPQARLDYCWDWGDWLDSGDAIQSYTLTPEAGIGYYGDSLGASPSTAQSSAAITAFVELDGGVVGDRLGITCHIVTTAGREDDRTKHFLIIEK